MAFANGFVLSLSLCLDLGVVNAAIIGTALRSGSLRAFMVGLGSCFGDLLYAVLSLAGLALVAQLAPVRWALWICGSVLLIWLAGRAMAAAWRERGGESQQAVAIDTPLAPGAAFIRGLALAVASPSSLVWFGAIGGALISRATDGAAGSIAAFLSGFFCAGLIWSAGVAVTFGRLRHRAGRRFAFWAHLTSALLFAALAALVIADGMALLDP